MNGDGELRFSTLLGLVIGMTMATAAFYEPLPLWMPIPLALLGAWRLWPAWRSRPPPRIPRHFKVAVLILLAGTLWLSGRIGFGLEGAGALFIVLLWSKMLELHGARDLHSTCAIALFLVAAQLLSSQSLAQCLFAVGSSLALLAVLVHWHLTGTQGSAYGDGAPLRTWWRSLRTSGLIIAQALPFVIILFLCVPRPSISPGIDRRVAESGVSDHLEPGAVASLALSQALAFRVEFLNGRAPAMQRWYWRGVVLWNTDGVTWGRQTESRDQAGLLVQPPLSRGDEYEYDITLQPTNKPWIYTLDCPMRAVTPGSDSRLYRPKPGYVWEAGEPIGNTRLYRARSRLVDAGDDPWEADVERSPKSCLVVHGAALLDRRILQLRDQLLARSSLPRQRTVDPELAIKATLDWFKTSGFVYTLRPGAMGINPTATFLFEKRRGFCEHYASAFSLLMRLMGIPSRVVVGYYGGDVNTVGGFIDVRQSNAHAWSEVWVIGEGWRRVDPTTVIPAVDTDGNPIPDGQQINPHSLAGENHNWITDHLHGLLQRWDYVEAEWDRWALAYDQDSLTALEKRLGLSRLGALAPWLALLGLSLPLLWLMLVLMRRQRDSDDAVQAVWNRLCARLARAGMIREPSEGPLDFSRRAAGSFPSQAEAVSAIVNGYVELRYGPPLPTPEQRVRLRRLRKGIRTLRITALPPPPCLPATRVPQSPEPVEV